MADRITTKRVALLFTLILAFWGMPAAAHDARLDGLEIAAPAAAHYDRVHDFGGWKAGAGQGEDRLCLDTRGQALAAASTSPITRSAVSASGHCTVLTGAWHDPYSGADFTRGRDVDVDHVVPLKEAWVSGAWAWTPAQRRAYANDLVDAGHLLVVSAHENRAKGDKDPAKWMPPAAATDPAIAGWYLEDWIAIKKRWALSIDVEEAAALDAGLQDCPAR